MMFRHRGLGTSLPLCARTASGLVAGLALSVVAFGQSPPDAPSRPVDGVVPVPIVESVRRVPAPQAVSSVDLVRRALTTNRDFAAARLDIERARARRTQAGLRPNPSVDFEQRTGRLTGAPGEGETSIGVAVPLELFGQRAHRIDVAEAEIALAEADVANRERQLAADVRKLYADALAARRDLEVLGELQQIDRTTEKFIRVRVSEGESAPLELRLLQTEMAQLASRKLLAEGRFEAALLELRQTVGTAEVEPLSLREDLVAVGWTGAPKTAAEAVETALRTRPDLRLARLVEVAADAGLRLARAEAAPQVTAFGKFSYERSVFDDTPVGALTDRDKTLAFGVSIGLPVFNRNQGATAEAAVATFEQGVIDRSIENVTTIRSAYQIGAYRITELLAEQRRLADAQREFTETLAERYRALAELQSAMGLPPVDLEQPRPPRPRLDEITRDGYPGVKSVAGDAAGSVTVLNGQAGAGTGSAMSPLPPIVAPEDADTTPTSGEAGAQIAPPQ